MVADKKMGRQRERRNKDLERYVRRDARGYIRYKHPLMDKIQYFGKDLAAANEVARIVNSRLSSQERVISAILDPRGGDTFDQVAHRFETEFVPTLKWSESYLRENTGRLAILRRELGDSTFQALEVLDISEAIDNNFKGDGRRLARNVLIHLYRFAIGKGLRRGTNVAEEVLQTAKAPRQRHRIANYSDFLRIREHADDFVRDAMDLSLITLQARQELCSMRLKQDEGELLRVVRQKTAEKTDAAYMEIEIGADLRAVLHRCKVKAMRCGSPFMLNAIVKGHHRSDKKLHRTQVLPNHLSTRFKAAVNACGLYDHLPEAVRPTLHEVRSLGGRIYKALGIDDEDIQRLMGHSKISTTEIYLEGDKVLWTRARATLELSMAATAKVRE